MGARARGAMGDVGPGSAHCIFSAWPLELPSLTFSATSVAVVDEELSCYDLPNAEPPYRAMAIIMPVTAIFIGQTVTHWHSVWLSEHERPTMSIPAVQSTKKALRRSMTKTLRDLTQSDLQSQCKYRIRCEFDG